MPVNSTSAKVWCGERGIRTPGPLQVNGFQDRRNRPLCHLSGGKITHFLITAKKQYTCLISVLPNETPVIPISLANSARRPYLCKL